VTGAIWLASYPRSGNTWTRLALKSLQGGGDDFELDEVSGLGGMLTGRDLVDRTLEVDSGLLTHEEALELRPDVHAAICADADPPLLAKTHDAWIRTPSGRPLFDSAFTHDAIYIVRDPRDVAVSWARFTASSVEWSVGFLGDHEASLGQAGGPSGIQVRQPMGSWSDHVLSWIDESGFDPLVVRYEDMLADPAAELTRIARRIGWDASPEAVARAVEATRFSRLADKEKRRGFRERSPRTASFFHSGKAGTWRDALEPELAARVERDHREVMERFGYL
jgi:aryl sulfotransferase